MSKITTSADLFPCPLCGNQPRLVDMCGWEIDCSCGVNLCLESADKAPLVTAWNTRAAMRTAKPVPNVPFTHEDVMKGVRAILSGKAEFVSSVGDFTTASVDSAAKAERDD